MSFERFHQYRTTPEIREKYAEVKLSADQFIIPLFVVEGQNVKQEIPGLQHVFHLSPDCLLNEIDRLKYRGINKVMLFGVLENSQKDEEASAAYQKGSLIAGVVEKIKQVHPDVLVYTDVCLCGYASHGHCGVFTDVNLDNEKTIQLLAKMAFVHAAAGADFVCPSAMMDGQVYAIRQLLSQNGLAKTKILGYSAKFQSSFYDPFRGAANSAPRSGDRKTYQIDYRTTRQALDEVGADINEGADWVMVKPAHAYLDVIGKVKERYPDVPLAAYHVSGEYMIIKAAAAAGLVDESLAALEVNTAIKRAGADFIISYMTDVLYKFFK